MAENGLCEDNESIVNCEDEEMVRHYRQKGVEAVNFRIVREENDLEGPTRKSNSFKPLMSHQIFGATEMIFGYKQLNIDLFYLHNSARCFVDIQAADKVAESELQKADDIMKALDIWLPENYRTNKADFIKDLRQEDHAKIFGETIETFKGKNKVTYKITLCDTKDEEFKEFHQRFATFIVWFIDGANFIDLEDTRWMIFYVYQENKDEKNNQTYRSPVGFCTAYRFYHYPNSTRTRISQFFVQPIHQQQGIGTKLYSTVFNYLKALPEVVDITVEEPTDIFQQIRDFCDSLAVCKDLKANQIDLCPQNQKQINQYICKQKFCKKQSQRVVDILGIVMANDRERSRYNESIKRRIASGIQREMRVSKRLCNLERAGIVVEQLDRTETITSDYNKYTKSLEWPVDRLKNYLQNST